jgi:hypothetical protein
MINQSRRTLLKGIGYGITTVAAGVGSSAAMAAFKKPTATVNTVSSALPTCDITIYQQQSSGKEVVSLMNLTDQPITLDKITPVGLEHVNGSLVVKVNKVSDGMIIEAGERLSFEVEAISANLIQDSSPVPNVLAGHLKIQSNHPSFNGIIPVTVFDSQVA